MKTSLKYLEHAYVPATTQLSNRLPGWHPFRHLRMESKGHQLMNATMGAGLETLRGIQSEIINSMYLSTAPTDQVASMWGISPPARNQRTEDTSRNMLKNSGFEWTPQATGIAWNWDIIGTGISVSTDKAFYGGRCLKVEVPAGQSVSLIQALNPILARKNVGISLWYNGDNVLAGADGLRIYLVGDKVSDGVTIPTSKALALGSTHNRFLRLTGAVNFAYDVNNVYFVINIANAASSTLTYYIDSAQAEMGSDVTPYRTSYNDAPWFVDTETTGPYDVFFVDGYKQRVIYCDSFDDMAYRSCPTRATLAALSRTVDLLQPTRTHSYKVEFDKSLWQTEFRIESNQVVRFNSKIPAEVFATYDLYELQDDNTMAVNSSAELIDLGVFGELLYVLAKEAGRYVLKVCNPEMAEPETDKLYVINTVLIYDPLYILDENVTGIVMYQATGRTEMFALKVTYHDEVIPIEIRVAVDLKFDYWMYDEAANQILTRENYNLTGGLIVV